ncbi:hypothetical protein ACF061_15855 [Streptomyces sp. NPDC015220]|uniref:hypothetical protein n=1 Tax=Streptomyces sp. NPDC015220 TaxID=3364947 RepID=UPI0036F5A523
MTLTFETSLPVQPGPAPDDFVLPKKYTKGKANRGPRLGDDVWDLRPFLPRTTRRGRVNFLVFDEGLQRRTAQQYAFAVLRETPGNQRWPVKPTTLPQEIHTLRRVWANLRTVGIERLQDVRREHLEALLPLMRRSGPNMVEDQVTTLKRLAEFGPFLSYDRLTLRPWPYRTARQISGLANHHENSTPRIPEEIMRPFLAAAVFYVRYASGDILAARDDLARMAETTKAEPVPAPFGRDGSPTRAKIERFIAHRRAEGRGLPALPLERVHTVPGATVIDGVVQAPNLAMIRHLTGTRHLHHLRHLLTEAGNELGWEQGGLPTPRTPWPATGRPWRAEFSPTSVNAETVHLRVACWIVIAYLSGMRDMEVRELGRDCAIKEIGADGRTRYKIRGRVYKNRKMSGDEADWVVLDIVHEAVEVLKLINDDPTHLFGYRLPSDYVLLSNMPRRLKNFRDHLNALFSTPEESYIPALAAEDLGLNTESEPANSDESDEEQNEDPLAWAFDTRQFRRTLAWHIANQPFGVVAGTRQYKHASHAIFEGYAGTSASGFADEVAADKAVALLDYVEDLYHDWNEGGRSASGAVKRVEAEFDRIRAELGDLPGAVASPERLRTMLRHLTRTLHPGALNDCFHHAETAVCGKRAKNVRQPLPMLNMCLSCPNSRRSAVHIPRMRLTRDLAHEEFKDIRGVPVLQEAAIREFETTLDAMIAELHAEEGSPL